MNISEIKAELDEGAVVYKSKAKKQELLQLLEGKRQMDEMRRDVLKREIAKAKELEVPLAPSVSIPYGIPPSNTSSTPHSPLPTSTPASTFASDLKGLFIGGIDGGTVIALCLFSLSVGIVIGGVML